MDSSAPAIRSAVRSALESFEAGDLIIVAVSGGADSLALAYALSLEVPKFAIQLQAVTIDHQLRSESGVQTCALPICIECSGYLFGTYTR